MGKVPAILSAALTVSLAACGPDDHEPLGQPWTAPIVTSDSTRAGTLTIFNSTDGLFVTADAAPGWELAGARLAVTTSVDQLPKTKSGNANLSRFLLRRTCRKAAVEIQFALPLLVDPGTPLYISLRADVQPVQGPPDADGGHDCDEHRMQAGWPVGTPFGGSDGATYVTYTVQSASAPTLAGQYRTHAQETWGSSTPNDASTFLMNGFMMDFPTGITVGTKNRFTARFSSAQAVANFLPQAGTPAALGRSVSNPADLQNAFAGNTLALALNAGFASDPSFSPAAGVAFGDLVVADPASPFYGVTVTQLLTMANDLLGGLGTEYGMSIEETNDAVMKVNANFENHGDLKFLGLP